MGGMGRICIRGGGGKDGDRRSVKTGRRTLYRLQPLMQAADSAAIARSSRGKKTKVWESNNGRKRRKKRKTHWGRSLR